MYEFQSFYFYLYIVIIAFIVIWKTLGGGKNQCYYIVCFTLFFISAFRGVQVGGDLENYLPTFHSISYANGFQGAIEVVDKDLGYAVLVKLLTYLSSSDRYFLIVTSSLSLIGPFYFIKKYSPWPLFSILLYYLFGYYTGTFNNIRQSIAITIMLFSISFLIKKNKLMYAICLATATLIHNSAVFTIAYLLKFIRINFISTLLILLLSFLVFYFFGSTIIVFFVTNYFGRFDETILNTGGGGYGMLTMYISLFIFLLWIFQTHKKSISDVEITRFFLVLLEVAIFFQFFATLATTIVRVTTYFFVPIVVLIPILLSSIKTKVVRATFSFLILFVLTYYMCHFIYSYTPETRSNFQGVIPYTFSLE